MMLKAFRKDRLNKEKTNVTVKELTYISGCDYKKALG